MAGIWFFEKNGSATIRDDFSGSPDMEYRSAEYQKEWITPCK